MTEEFKHQVIKKLVDTNGNKNAAELKLGCTRHTINRMIKGYLEEGKSFFQHGNKGRKPVNAKDESLKQAILTMRQQVLRCQFHTFC